MALNIEFEGFVDSVKVFNWGKVAKVSHAQRAKNDTTGEWETVGKDYLDVVLPAGVDVIENTKVRVVGTFKASTYEKKDGSAGVALKVRASVVTPIESRGNATALSKKPDYAAPFTPPAGWESVQDPELPF